VRTLVISDLHLGAGGGSDLLRRAELRDGPHRDVAALAAPLFEDLGRALGADGELLLLGGNHDHGLVAGWIDGRLLTEPAGFLALEQRFEPADAGPLAAALAGHARPARTQLAYPGVWLRDDVYAIHGHYSDLHATVPTFERLAAGAMARWVVKLPADGAAPDDYEAALAPLYAWIHALTQRGDHTLVSAGTGASARAWVAMGGRGRGKRPIRTAALNAGFRAVVAAINAIGLGPVSPDLSGTGLRRGYLRGFAEVVRRLSIDAPHVVWGHSHRSGPWPGDDLAEWTTHAGGRMVNTGSWVYQPHFLSPEPNRSPYWPGTAVLIDESGPPELVRLLGERGHRELRPPG
jgi:hypothetical protein